MICVALAEQCVMWKKWCAYGGQEPIHVGKKGGRPAHCLLMMTNLAVDVTLIILPLLNAPFTMTVGT